MSPQMTRPRITCTFVLSLVLLLLCAPTSSMAVVGPPCCSPPPPEPIKFVITTLNDIDHLPDMPVDAEAMWLYDQLNKQDKRTLTVMGIALNAYCDPQCEKKFSVAKAVTAAVLAEHSRAEEHSFGFFYALIALLGTLATIVFGRVEAKRSERTICTLLQQLASREGDAQQGAPADRPLATLCPADGG